MKWSLLLQPIRLHDSKSNIKENIRSPFLRDVDKILFSSYFRKLQDKTQVYPLAKSSYIRTRLTHSLEVASVGRSLGNIIGKEIIKKYKLENYYSNISFYDFGYIVQAAALAHDIGNPPFGHKGEESICNFYENLFEKLSQIKINSKNSPLIRQLDKELQNLTFDNFTKFDGNAQGFRIITTISGKNNLDGLNLTYPVLASFCKYPNSTQDKNFLTSKKIGIFTSETKIFNDIKNKLQLKINTNNLISRHPLAFLLEAADDICYLVADSCDAFSTNILEFNEVIEMFANIIFSKASSKVIPKEYKEYLKQSYKESLTTYKQSNIILQKNLAEQIIESLASDVINIATLVAAKTFLEHEENIINGKFNNSLLGQSELNTYIDKIRTIAREKIYAASEKTTQEIKGTTAIQEVLKEFTNIVINLYLNKSTAKDSLINKLYFQNKIKLENSLYSNLQLINDFIVGCTDKNIIEIFHTIKGI